MTWRPALWLVAAAVVILDQVSKQLALAKLEPGVVHPIFGKWLAIELVRNPGAAFSLGNSFTWIVTGVGIAVCVGIVIFAKRAQTSLAVWLFGLVLGGAVANIIDRVLRAPGFGQGHVVDFINYNRWFVGNIADIAIVGGAIAFALLAAFGVKILEPKPTAGDAQAEPAEASGDAERA